MLKYYNSMVVFEEIPDEITLAINITNCPCKCPGCHSKFLWGDVGTELTIDELDRLISKNDGITAVCFMGGDSSPSDINKLAGELLNSMKHDNLKIGWYSGRDELSEEIDLELFNYIKLGHYDEKYGGLDKETTNQRFYFVDTDFEGKYILNDKTHLFWRKTAK